MELKPIFHFKLKTLLFTLLFGSGLPCLQYGLYKTLIYLEASLHPDEFTQNILKFLLVLLPMLVAVAFSLLFNKGTKCDTNVFSFFKSLIAVCSGIAASILVGNYAVQLLAFLLEKVNLWNALASIRMNPIEYSLDLEQGYYQILVIFYIPMLEELWYRELTLSKARFAFGDAAAIVISSLFFSVSHVFSSPNLQHFTSIALSIFLTGIIYGILRVRFGLYAAIIGHSLQNFLALNYPTLPSEFDYFWGSTLAALGLLVFVYTIRGNLRKSIPLL